MADNKFNNNKKVYVAADFENITIIDPNKIVNEDGTVEERLVDHENLVIYANLEARIIPRTKLAIGSSYSDSVRTVGVGQLNVNFLKGNQTKDIKTETNNVNLNTSSSTGKNPTYMDTNWTDQFLFEQRKTAQDTDTQLLGITRISIKVNASFVPTVTIEMTDIQGKVLFEHGDQSPYGVFFQMPYPVFILTVKGYYGKAIKYELMLETFNARFDPSDGSYKITTNFKSRSHALLNDTMIDFLYATPHMYSKIYEENSKNTNTLTSSSDRLVPVTPIETTKGFEKIKETYNLYKQKGLIDESFPNMTLNKMIMKLENFNKLVMESYDKEDMSVLTNIVDYENNLNEYRSEIFPNSGKNWFNKYIEKYSIVILKDTNAPILYELSGELDTIQKKVDALSKLGSIIDEYNNKLSSNPTFGGDGKYVIDGNRYGNSEIVINIKKSDFIKKIYNYDDIDFKATYTRTNGRTPTDQQEAKFRSDFIKRLELESKVFDENFQLVTDLKIKGSFIIFGNKNYDTNFSDNSFLGKLSDIDNKFQTLKNDIEEKLTKSLAEKLQSTEIGLGFSPTINNVLAVICAGADAFYKLMDDVHKEAWEVRNNPIRLKSIIPPDKIGVSTDGKISKETVFETIVTDNGVEKQVLKDTASVYPWPEYFEKEEKDGKVLWQIKYPGDTDSVKKTQAWDYTIWPEVKFVEEYIKGSLERENTINLPILNNERQNTPYVFPNAIEFPFQTSPYLVGDNLSLLYEIWERTYLISNYTKLAKNNGFRDTMYLILGNFEVKNVTESILNAPNLKKILQEYRFTYPTFINELKSGSNNGQGVLWNQKIRDIFTNITVNSAVKNDFGIYSIDSLNSNSTNVDGIADSLNKLEEYLRGSDSNVVDFLDVFPFNNLGWLKNNLSNGDSVISISNAYSTTNILKFDKNKKTFTTFDDTTDNSDSKTYLTYLDFQSNLPGNPNQILTVNLNNQNGQTGNYNTQQQVISYYQNREINKRYLTESVLDYGSDYNTVTNKLISKQTTSLLNTSYFVNSILKSVDNKRANINNPNVTLGYMYLNSLPLSTLSEKYLTKEIQDNGSSSDVTTDYIFAGLSKMSAIHKMSYLWVLKYGSIWYRYKTFIETNVDILNDVWKDFDYFDGYDPLTQDFTKPYQIKNYTGGTINYNTEELNTSVLVLNTNEELIINNGLYPKVINSLYYFFTGKDVFTDYTQSEWNSAYTDKGLRIGLSNRENIQNYDNSNPNRSLDLRSWFQYFNISGSTDFTYNVDDKLLLVPSSGYLKFNQSKLECFNDLNKITQPIQANQAIQNGNVRSFWAAPNFGYFNNDWIKKPNFNEYIKIIDNSKNQQDSFNIINNNSNSSYKSIDEIFAIFSKEILDEFERHFLNFCNTSSSYSDIIINPTEVNNNEYLGSQTTKYNWNIEQVMKSLFIVDKPSEFSGENSIKDVEIISNRQAEDFVNKNTNELRNSKVVLKIGNPGGFNRKVFDSFSTNETLIPEDKIVFGTYVNGSLPTQNGTTTLSVSQSLYPDAWDAMYLYIGNYRESRLAYSDTGSIFTDFFVDMDIEFTKDNVINLSKIIKIYGSLKYNDSNLTTSNFRTQYEDFMNLQSQFQVNILNHMFSRFNSELPKVTETEDNTIVTKLDGDLNKNEMWATFKNFNDRWISGQDFKDRTLFEEFLFLDNANRPIGDEVIVNIENLRLFLRNSMTTLNVYQLIGHILEDNNFTFMPVPSYANFYGINRRSRNNQPDPKNSPIGDDTFGTFLEVDTYGSEPKFLAIYVGKTSEHPATSESNKNFLYKDDSFLITRSNPNPLIESENKTDFSKRNKVVGFNVDFGVREQGIFKSISLDMAQRKNIAPSFQVVADMGSMGEGQKVAQQTASLYNFYKNGSYNCTVTSMGNVMIQPTMYFNLQYVPMFYGAYLIINVNHDITSNDFVTTFEGVRVPIYSLPLPDDLVSSVNRQIVQSFKTQIKRGITSVGVNQRDGDIREESVRNSSINNNGKKETTENNCSEFAERNVQYVPLERKEINATNLKSLINSKSPNYSQNQKKYLFSTAFVESGGDNASVNTINYNLYNLKNDKTKPKFNISYDKQVCVLENNYSVPYIAFNSFDEPIMFMSSFIRNYDVLISSFLENDKINNDLARAFTYIWYYTLRYTTRNTVITQTGIEDNQIIATIDSLINSNPSVKTLFDEAYKTYLKFNNHWDVI
jgi:hypothetical protein